ncbi:hypothetical protein KBG_80 [Mycobacterium phage KBG]|uniref:Uncharacterized protein n=2 Tax=Fromanvirus TaxID=186764 RepID=B3VG51_9CAUD|nr:site-specific recombination directionality factor RDF [Mycobacterium phage KBG]ACE79828.1 hypothetical protein KBG_80 [Mycobacterium phage KBG]
MVRHALDPGASAHGHLGEPCRGCCRCYRARAARRDPMTLSDAIDLINAERVKWLRFCEAAAARGDKEDCLVCGGRASGLADALVILAKVVP